MIPRGRARRHHRQHRPALLRPQPLVQHLGADRTRRRRHHGDAQPRITGRPPTTSTICGCRCRSGSPASTFSFVPADIVTQILNFGLPAPIDIQVVGRNIAANRLFAGAAGVEAGAGAGHRRPARAAGVQPAAAAPRRRPHARRAARADPARRRHQPADLALRQQPDHADVLAEPDDRRQLRRRDADAAVPAWRRCRTSATSR